MAFSVPSYRELEKIIDDYVTDHGYKSDFMPEGSPDTADSVRISLDEEDIPGLVSHLAMFLQQRNNSNLYFFDAGVNREFMGLKQFLDRMTPESAKLFLKTMKLQAGLLLKENRRDVSI